MPFLPSMQTLSTSQRDTVIPVKTVLIDSFLLQPSRALRFQRVRNPSRTDRPKRG
jgi:hypothetical protein